eukprot:augustus_masked-scaffold_8-processed-gene-11.43-mRNA-1 protein AED:1.00 eAED:1.00 QI:0/-1/0/0/-1/1/1/0/273
MKCCLIEGLKNVGGSLEMKKLKRFKSENYLNTIRDNNKDGTISLQAISMKSVIRLKKQDQEWKKYKMSLSQVKGFLRFKKIKKGKRKMKMFKKVILIGLRELMSVDVVYEGNNAILQIWYKELRNGAVQKLLIWYHDDVTLGKWLDALKNIVKVEQNVKDCNRSTQKLTEDDCASRDRTRSEVSLDDHIRMKRVLNRSKSDNFLVKKIKRKRQKELYQNMKQIEQLHFPGTELMVGKTFIFDVNQGESKPKYSFRKVVSVCCSCFERADDNLD